MLEKGGFSNFLLLNVIAAEAGKVRKEARVGNLQETSRKKGPSAELPPARNGPALYFQPKRTLQLQRQGRVKKRNV